MSGETPEPGMGWHTYRCPVCGHTDEVDLAEGAPRSIECSHCGTALEVVVHHREDAAAAVTVSKKARDEH
jgi:uncharacterized Zn finger protein